MQKEYYEFNGKISKCKDIDFFIELFEQYPYNKYVVKEKIRNILADDEKMEIEFPDLYPGLFSNLLNLFIVGAMVTSSRLGWRNSAPINIYINLKASTIALIAILLDINVTKGIANFVLAATGVNLRLIVKLDETVGEKCVLLEVYRKENHQANPDIFKQVYGKECINNDMNCKYRSNEVCTMGQERVKEIFESLKAKNVFTKHNDCYKYNF